MNKSDRYLHIMVISTIICIISIIVCFIYDVILDNAFILDVFTIIAFISVVLSIVMIPCTQYAIRIERKEEMYDENEEYYQKMRSGMEK